MKLSKEDIKRLKSADRICFDFYRKDDEEIHQIRAIKELRDEWNSEKTVEIPAEGYFTGTYQAEVERAFYMNHSPQVDRGWKTITELLKPGDEILLQWCKGYGDCDLLRNSPVPVTIDHLYLEIWRENSKEQRKIKHTFFLAYQTSKLDRLVAMIKPL